MERANKVSLWLGFFESKNKFKKYIEKIYLNDDEILESQFERDFNIKYNEDYIETKWDIFEYNDIKLVLEGFSYDYEIIPKFQEITKNINLLNYNSVILLYNFEFNKEKYCYINNLDYMGCIEAKCCYDKELFFISSNNKLGTILFGNEKKNILKKLKNRIDNSNLIEEKYNKYISKLNNEIFNLEIEISNNIFFYIKEKDELYLTEKKLIINYISYFYDFEIYLINFNMNVIIKIKNKNITLYKKQ